MASMSTRALIIQAQQQFYEEMRCEFQGLGSGSRYPQRQKEYTLRLIDDLG